MANTSRPVVLSVYLYEEYIVLFEDWRGVVIYKSHNVDGTVMPENIGLLKWSNQTAPKQQDSFFIYRKALNTPYKFSVFDKKKY